MKEVCKTCNYWTKNKNHKNFKCYCGSCPAKKRDEKEQNNKEKEKFNKFVIAGNNPKAY